MVPTNPEAIESKGMHKPLHKLAVGVSDAWTVQFDELSKLNYKNGIGEWGYRLGRVVQGS